MMPPIRILRIGVIDFDDVMQRVKQILSQHTKQDKNT